MSEIVLLACKELIDDAELGCADMVFKDVCQEILAKAILVLTNEQFEELMFFVAERIRKETVPGLGRRVRIRLKKLFTSSRFNCGNFLCSVHFSQ